MTAEESMRTQVRAALETAGISQAEACRQLGVSTKHLNQMFTGKATLTLDWAEKIIGLCGARILVCTTVPSPDRIDRIKLDDLTSNDLDELYDDLDRYQEVVGELNEANTGMARGLAALRQVARGYCPACGRGDAAPTVQDWEQQRDKAGRLEIANRALNTAALEAVERAEAAEAAIARVREVADRWKRNGTSDLKRYADILLTALDQAAPTAATQATNNQEQ